MRQLPCRPRCSVGDMSQVLLPRRGTLVALTTQGFPPGAPYKGPVGKDFVPFGTDVDGNELVTFAFQPV